MKTHPDILSIIAISVSTRDLRIYHITQMRRKHINLCFYIGFALIIVYKHRSKVSYTGCKVWQLKMKDQINIGIQGFQGLSFSTYSGITVV